MTSTNVKSFSVEHEAGTEKKLEIKKEKTKPLAELVEPLAPNILFQIVFFFFIFIPVFIFSMILLLLFTILVYPIKILTCQFTSFYYLHLFIVNMVLFFARCRLYWHCPTLFCYTILPTDPKHFTPKFLTQFLQRSGYLEKDEEIIESTVLHLAVVDGGQLAEGSKVEVKYNQENLNKCTKFFIKIPRISNPMLHYQIETWCNKVETNFYKERENHFKNIKIPKCFGVEHFPSVGSYVIILEDLSNCRFCSKNVVKFKPEDAPPMVRLIANFHAETWNNVDAFKNTKDIRTISKCPENCLIPSVSRSNFPKFIKCLKNDYKIEFPDEYLDCHRKLMDLKLGYVDYENSFGESMNLPVMVTHGDYHSGNVFFEGEEAGMFDFQIVNIRYGPGLDLATAFGSMETKMLFDNIDDMLDLYLETLAKAGIEFDKKTLEICVALGALHRLNMFTCVELYRDTHKLQTDGKFDDQWTALQFMANNCIQMFMHFDGPKWFKKYVSLEDDTISVVTTTTANDGGTILPCE